MTDTPECKVIKFYPQDAYKDPNNVLEQAHDVYDDVLILGWDKNGVMEARASAGFRDGSEMLWILEKFKTNLMLGAYESPPEHEDE